MVIQECHARLRLESTIYSVRIFFLSGLLGDTFHMRLEGRLETFLKGLMESPRLRQGNFLLD